METQQTMKAKVSAKGWVVIPAALRKKFQIKPGTLVEFKETGGGIIIIPKQKDPVEELYGKLAEKPSLIHALMESRKEESQREEKRLRAR